MNLLDPPGRLAERLTVRWERVSSRWTGSRPQRFVQWWRAVYGRYQALWTTAFLLGAIALAFAAQRQFDENRDAGQWDDWHLPAVIAFDAMVLFGLVTGRERLERPPHEPPPPISWESSLPLLVAGLLFSAASALWFTGNTIRVTGLLLLLAGAGLALVALYISTSRERDESPAPRSRGGLAWQTWLLLGIVGLGAFLRFYKLDAIPGEMSLDQISKFWDVRDVLLGNKAPVFFEANQGREGLFFYLLALTSQVAGLGYLSMKLTSAAIGVASIPAMYFFGKEMAGRWVGLLAAFLLAVSKWHIILSRLGYRVVLVPVLIILAMAYLVRGLRRGHLFDYGLAGVMLGLGMYSYKSFPFAIPAALSCVALYALRRGRRPLLGGLVMLVLAAVVFVPMGVYAIESWDEYAYRENLQVELLEKHYAGSDLTPVEGYLVNLRKTVLMNNFVGDPIQIYNPPHERFLGPVSAALLILGLGYVLGRLTRGHNAVPVLFMLWLMQPVAVSMFPPHEQPNALRAAATIGPSLFVAAVSVPAVQRRLARVWAGRLRPLQLLVSQGGAPGEQGDPSPSRRFVLRPVAVLSGVVVLACVLALGLEAKANYESVFTLYPFHQRFHGHPLGRQVAEEVEDWLGVAPVFIRYSYTGVDVGLIKVYLTSWGVGDTWQPDDPEAPGGYQVNSLALDEPPLSRQDLPLAVFILYPGEAQGDLEILKQRYPDHVVINRTQPYGDLAYVVFVGHE
jgi:4-amino-4-deoxy-L-arabinose transferase-like glycosyltransferase